MSDDIVRVWGTADSIPIELHKLNGRWVCDLPPDFVDGQYAVQLSAQKANGKIGVWTGILYVCDGIACLHLKPEKYTLWLCPERIQIHLIKECCQNV